MCKRELLLRPKLIARPLNATLRFSSDNEAVIFRDIFFVLQFHFMDNKNESTIKMQQSRPRLWHEKYRFHITIKLIGYKTMHLNKSKLLKSLNIDFAMTAIHVVLYNKNSAFNEAHCFYKELIWFFSLLRHISEWSKQAITINSHFTNAISDNAANTHESANAMWSHSCHAF